MGLLHRLSVMELSHFTGPERESHVPKMDQLVGFHLRSSFQWFFTFTGQLFQKLLLEKAFTDIYLVLLCFSLSHVTDVVIFFFTDRRQDPPLAERL